MMEKMPNTETASECNAEDENATTPAQGFPCLRMHKNDATTRSNYCKSRGASQLARLAPRCVHQSQGLAAIHFQVMDQSAPPSLRRSLLDFTTLVLMNKRALTSVSAALPGAIVRAHSGVAPWRSKTFILRQTTLSMVSRRFMHLRPNSGSSSTWSSIWWNAAIAALK